MMKSTYMLQAERNRGLNRGFEGLPEETHNGTEESSIDPDEDDEPDEGAFVIDQYESSISYGNNCKRKINYLYN